MQDWVRCGGNRRTEWQENLRMAASGTRKGEGRCKPRARGPLSVPSSQKMGGYTITPLQTGASWYHSRWGGVLYVQQLMRAEQQGSSPERPVVSQSRTNSPPQQLLLLLLLLLWLPSGQPTAAATPRAAGQWRRVT